MSARAADADLEVAACRIALDQRGGVAQQRSDRDRLLAERARARKHQHVLHDAIQPVEPRDDVDQNGAIALVGRHPRRDHLQRTADARDRVLHLVRNHRGHFAELRERFLFRQPLLEQDAVAQVVKDAREAAFAVVGLHLPDRQMHGKGRAVLAAGGDFAADADDLLFARREVMVKVPVVALAVGARHQHVHVASEHFADAIAKQPLC